MAPRPPEATLADDRFLLVALSPEPLGFEFFGTVITRADLAAGRHPTCAGKTVYLAGEIATFDLRVVDGAARVLVIDELSPGYHGELPRVGLGTVPIRVGGGIGVFYRRLFDDAGAYFRRICAEHAFQALTESVKPSKAHRTGLYLTPVTREGDELHFHLLRCSTNLAGPTENFCATDREIASTLAAEAARLFRDHAPLNHVLAQIYGNTPATGERRETKARISAHADKTKDMPANGIMAFCTFYDEVDKLAPLPGDPFDRGYKGKTGLTRLRFRRKHPADDGRPAELALTLYPGSVLFVPLSTNRLYTHQIQASMLDAGMLPTRLGYVARCSKTAAVHVGGSTYLELGDRRVPLEPPTEQGMAALRALYAEENRSDGFIDYGDRFTFSMNRGDYQAPDEKP